MVQINSNSVAAVSDAVNPDQFLVRVNLPESFPIPVYASPDASIRKIWTVVRDLDPDEFRRHAAIIHPLTGTVIRAGRKFTEQDPVKGLQNGVEI